MEIRLRTKRLRISGMTCVNCQRKIEKKLRGTAGVTDAKVSYKAGSAEVTYDSDIITVRNIVYIIEKLDYHVLSKHERQTPNTGRVIGILIIIASLYMVLQHFGILNLLAPGQLAETNMGYGMLFVIGLVTSVHCVAMCGGINLSQCIPRGHSEQNSILRPTFLYNLGRVISYTVVGFIVGALGSVITFSNTTQGILKLIAGLFMVIMGINMLGIFPWLRKLNPSMPKIFSSKINRAKRGSERMSQNLRPLVVGLLNGLMPCGPLQAMQIYALSTGSPVEGAISMFVFSVGTVPLMFALGAVSSGLGKKFTRQVMTAGAVLVVVLGLSMLTQGLNLSGHSFNVGAGIASSNIPSAENKNSNYNNENNADEDSNNWNIPQTDTDKDNNDIEMDNDEDNDDSNAVIEAPVNAYQLVNSTLSSRGYPNIVVQAGTPVKWIIDAPQDSITGCNGRMIIQEYGLEHTFEAGENVIEFNPMEPGEYMYTCWMGMIRGLIKVTEA
ncbi:MAG: sulfite exporter TauE/SafE family protein [Clostridiales bacterium]|jgi:sulfite exporter TauE/SafE/copper chaperone CopZ|nr:sulfite exporter TauE/SafE family protein [Clostridiales bacterium]